MKSAYWFRHDANAHEDPKLLALLANEGFAAYGRWWLTLEYMRAQNEYCIGKDKLSTAALAHLLHLTVDDCGAWLYRLVKDYGLLRSNAKAYYSSRLQRDMEHVTRVSEQAATNGKASGAVRRLRSLSVAVPLKAGEIYFDALEVGDIFTTQKGGEEQWKKLSKTTLELVSRPGNVVALKNLMVPVQKIKS